MNSFFDTQILKQIIENESNPKKIHNFLTNDFCNELLKCRKNIQKKMVDREESTKLPFDWNDHIIFKELKKKIENITGTFNVNDFEPHFITTRFPLRLHADTGKNPNDLIFKNIVIPLEINYTDEKFKHNKSHTLIFKNKWYNRSAIFTTKTSDNYDFIIKDHLNNFVDIVNIHDFKNVVNKTENDQIIKYNNNKFFVNEKFKLYINTLAKTKRYNIRTSEHIINDQKFDLEVYNKYLTHQPYEDCTSLEVDQAISWSVGSLIIWDRVRIHCSDNFLKNNIESKTCIALFTSK